MNFSRITRWLRFTVQYFPLKLNFILFVAGILLVAWTLQQGKTENNSFYELSKLMGLIVLVLAIVLSSVALLSVFIPWIHFLIYKGKPGQQDLFLQMQVSDENAGLVKTKTILPQAIRPLMGWVKVRLIYDQQHYTAPYTLHEKMRKSWIPFQKGIAGHHVLQLPDIREYHVQGAFIYFEDFLQLFSIPVYTKIQQQILNPAQNWLQPQKELPPKKTQEELVRIEQLRKVEGELLNYKKFEDSDDVRRIVWKIFAKNRELVVRIPEIMDPFASHVHFYASFFVQNSFNKDSAFSRSMLNHYKSALWTIYHGLSQLPYQLEYIPDQMIHGSDSGQENVRIRITLQDWHHETGIKDYFKIKTGSVLCLHSMSDARELNQLLEKMDTQTTIFLIRCSTVFRSYYVLNWISRLFLKPPQDELSRLRARWMLQPMRYQIKKNEKDLIHLLEKSGARFELI